MTTKPPPYAAEIHALEKSWAKRPKGEPDLERRQLLYGQPYEEAFTPHRHRNPVSVTDTALIRQCCGGPMALTRGRNVLEMGSGNGSAALLIAEAARSMKAVDAAEPLRAAIRQRMEAAGIRNLEILSDDVRLGSVGDNFIDVVFSNDFIEHLTVEDARTFLLSAMRILRPGGTIFTITPNKHAGPFDSTRCYALALLLPLGLLWQMKVHHSLCAMLISSVLRECYDGS